MPLPTRQSEHDLQNSIIARFEGEGWPVTRVNAGRFQNALTGSWVHGAEAGHPDLVVGYPSEHGFLHAYIEVKSSTGRLNDDQIRFLRKTKGLWLVAKTWVDVDLWLRDRDYHGDPKLVSAVTDPDSKFVSTQERTQGKRTKMDRSTVNEFDEFMASLPKMPEQPSDMPADFLT